ncbi:hypothetical protein FHG66_11845 [Rubellimicrobium rubrum]|uniref:Uncharacterized protein n=1 Tax=Rubellimicrobium rubrum TaxID=2585369 RepID=A0A5C4MXJ1_9RHOB|nr:hypothetical protein [Rubellimicrobium rubrum]TNC49136.1 hypothetical protein FHG66_11845 [Rubellimicrobium rubrum]
MLMGKKHFQELPLLPGEYEFLERTGRLDQFGEYKHKRSEFILPGNRAITLESVVSFRPGCACVHGHRPTVCRLYPLFPILDIDGRLTGVDQRFGVYEELEALEGIGRVCEVRSIPFDQLDLFIRFVGAIASSPLHLFHLQAYRVAKDHAFRRLREMRTEPSQSVFALFEGQFLRGRVFDQPALAQELGALADRFEARYGTGFDLGRTSSPVASEGGVAP